MFQNTRQSSAVFLIFSWPKKSMVVKVVIFQFFLPWNSLLGATYTCYLQRLNTAFGAGRWLTHMASLSETTKLQRRLGESHFMFFLEPSSHLYLAVRFIDTNAARCWTKICSSVKVWELDWVLSQSQTEVSENGISFGSDLVVELQ